MVHRTAHISRVDAQSARAFRRDRCAGAQSAGDSAAIFKMIPTDPCRNTHVIRLRSCTALFTLEHCKTAYRLDLPVQGGASTGMDCITPGPSMSPEGPDITA